MSISFYSRALPKCDVCRKPAMVEILGTGNVPYGHACNRCAAKRIRDLERAHVPRDATREDAR
jgi:hypothetical protein